MPISDLQAELEITGSFWLPGHADDDFYGVLRVSEEHEITLELSGVFGGIGGFFDRQALIERPLVPEQEPLNLERIVGFLENSRQVTLDGCIPLNESVNWGAGPSKSSFRARLCFIGAAYGDGEQPNFSEVSFTMDGLTEWLSTPAVETQFDTENQIGSISYRVPDDVVVHLDNERELRFTYSLTAPNPFHTQRFEAHVKQDAMAVLVSGDPEPLDHFASLAFRLCNFICLAMDQTVRLRSMTGAYYQQPNGGPERKREVKIYGVLDSGRESFRPVQRLEALFLYPGVAGQLEDMINLWLQNYEALEPAFNLYFLSTTQTNLFLETKVLFLAQALETLHRRNSDETDMPVNEFEERIAGIVQGVAQNLQVWLGEKLRYANELGFRRRLVRLVEPLERWFGTDAERRLFIGTMYATRNYLTHYEERGNRQRAVDPYELLTLLMKMEALFQLHLLSLVGLGDDAVDGIIERSPRLHRKISGQVR